jgi:carboxypeptidase C (cathepsin A)
MQHLGLQSPLRKNIEFAFYQSGHMVYAHQDALKLLHDNVADFIRRTAAPPH